MADPVYATTDQLASMGLPSEVLASLSADAQATALSSASRTVDTYLRGRYRMPLTSWGDDVRRTVCHLAAWDLLSTFGFNPESGADSAIRKRYEDAMRWLRDVAGGLVTPTVIDSSSGGVSLAPRVASRKPRGW